MKRLLIVFVFQAVWTNAYADYMVDFIRISCIRETQFLDIEYRPIHNNAVDAEQSSSAKSGKSIWAKHGFFDPGKLDYQCSLPESEYKVTATQSGWSERGMCGAAPEIHFSLYRNGVPIVENVIFGNSCFGNNSVTRVSIQDGRAGWYAREAEICFQKGADLQPKCKWFFEHLGNGWTDFPIRQESIEGYVSKSANAKQ